MTVSDTIAPALAGALEARGYSTLTPVQTAVLQEGAGERDLLVSAQTGSGKTVAFGMAIAPTILGGALEFGPAGAPLALVIAPTRELAMQVQRELEWLYKDAGGRIGSCVGGMDMRREIRALAAGAHIVVGTPGRLRDHITRGSLDISELRAVVLDEADEMLDLGFREDLEFILAAAPEERRTLLFSATVPRPIAELAKTFQRDALRITATSANQQHVDIDYRLLLVAPPERENAIINTLLYFDAQNTIVFCSTREAVKHLTSRLANRGFPVVALSGELSQAERTNALQSMRDGRARVCVATDVAARGIDLPNLDLVIHADLPTNPDTLLHRSGRTGRAGRKGTCALIVPHHRRNSAARVLKLAKLDATAMPAPTSDVIAEKNRERILQDPALAEAPTEDEVAFVEELLAAHSPQQIAAAYVRQQIASRPVAEEITETSVSMPSKGKGERFADSDGPAERFQDGVWFKVNVGRKHRAEPRWLLPLICRAGNITKREVGSIRLQEAESHFEVAPQKAEAFAAAIKHGSGEKGIVIQRIDEAQPERAPNGHREGQAPWSKDAGKPKYKGKPRPGADGSKGPKVYKPKGKKPKSAAS